MKHYLWQLRPRFRQVAGELVLGSLAGIVMNTTVVLPSILLGRAIDAVLALAHGQTPTRTVLWAALAYVGGTLASEGPRMLKRWWLITANTRMLANLRTDALRGVLARPLAEVQQLPIGDLMARVLGDIDVLGIGIREFTIEMWDTVLFSLSFIIAMIVYAPGLTVLVLLPTPLAFVLAYATGRWVTRRTRLAREANANLTATLQEQLAGLRVMRLFGHQQASVERVATLSQRQAAANLRGVQLRSALQPVYSLIITSGVVLLVWLGGRRVVTGALTTGAFVTYLQLYLRFVGRGFRIPQLVNSVQSGGAAYARLALWLAPALPVAGEPRLASFRPDHVAGSAQASLPEPVCLGGPLALILDHVTFRYPGAPSPVLTDLSLTIPAGSFVAITGPVGSGKSALARAVLGLYPLEAGAILVGGRSLTAWSSEERRSRIGYQPQAPFLFSGTVAENVLLPEPGRALAGARPRIAAAVEQAALGPDLTTFPSGLQTEIGELGMRVSGGQRQRIALARALAAPLSLGLLVLDDPFSSVDIATELQIVQHLRASFGPAAPAGQRVTILLLSHRLAAFPQADQVVILDGGHIREKGSHAELVTADGLYARIYRAQRQIEQDASVEIRS